jgi:CBS domain-containing protein
VLKAKDIMTADVITVKEDTTVGEIGRIFIEKGISGKPTAINNVETWANIPIIINEGAAEFAKVGIDNDALAAQLQDEGAKSFVDSWNNLMAVIASKSAALEKIAAR